MVEELGEECRLEEVFPYLLAAQVLEDHLGLVKYRQFWGQNV